MQGRLAAGHVVSVPLQSRLVPGMVVAVRRAPVDRLRPVHSLLDETPALNLAQLALARWMAAEYAAPLGRCCALMVPPGFTPRSSFAYDLSDAARRAPPSAPRGSIAERLLAILRARGPMLESALKNALKRGPPTRPEETADWRGALEALVLAQHVTRASTLEAPKAQAQRATLAQLVIGESTLDLALADLQQPGTSGAGRLRPDTRIRRAAVLRYLNESNGLAWADWIFAETGANRADLTWLSDQGYLMLGDAERWRDPLADTDYIVKEAPPLTDDQQQTWDAVSADSERAADGRPPAEQLAFLIRGVTGSGKTEIYMRAVDQAVRAGRGAIVLVPEISLTPQTARRFLERFPGKVALIHSRLRPGERFDTWRRIRAGELPIVVGARSGLFAPLPSVGVIVLDEEHDPSFKQNAAPYYDTRRVAQRYAQLCGAKLILGSATPSLESLAAALDPGGLDRDAPPWLRLLELPNRVRSHAHRVDDQQTRLRVRSTVSRETDAVVYQPLPEVDVIDMRAELRGGNTSMFSGALYQALSQTLERREQAILFLNRRGAASSVVCRDCGHVLRCPNDDTPLTLHRTMSAESRGLGTKPREGLTGLAPQPETQRSGLGTRDTEVLKCHTCTHKEPSPSRCPACNSARIRFLGIGTQTIEDELHKHFPAARVVRWDKDTASARDAADQMLKRFQNQQADVLIGTQMIAKGLDLPLVTLVGVVMADVGLFLPDFRASERGFNLIEQVAGRAGRALLPGRVIVQTYNPDHAAIAFAARHDVKGFARHELAQRKLLDLPPYTRLVKFETSDPSNEAARQACEGLARELRRRVAAPSDVIGPASCYFGRRDKKYRWQILVRTQSPAGLLSGLDVPRGFIVDVDPASVL